MLDAVFYWSQKIERGRWKWWSSSARSVVLDARQQAGGGGKWQPERREEKLSVEGKPQTLLKFIGR